mmetsp:Transcript_13362/g.18668  ORF Transcript_13362/g.18668 Transcript_13362/m.18668 type:complete len:203 (+) Transcript_13362:232-840(+)
MATAPLSTTTATATVTATATATTTKEAEISSTIMEQISIPQQQQTNDNAITAYFRTIGGVATTTATTTTKSNNKNDDQGDANEISVTLGNTSPSVPLSSRVVLQYNGFQTHGQVVDESSDRHHVTNYFRNMGGLMDTTTSTQQQLHLRGQESPSSSLPPKQRTLASFALQQASFSEAPLTDDPTVLTTSATDYFRSMGGFQR